MIFIALMIKSLLLFECKLIADVKHHNGSKDVLLKIINRRIGLFGTFKKFSFSSFNLKTVHLFGNYGI